MQVRVRVQMYTQASKPEWTQVRVQMYTQASGPEWTQVRVQMYRQASAPEWTQASAPEWTQVRVQVRVQLVEDPPRAGKKSERARGKGQGHRRWLELSWAKG
jgi:hypothetical protein